MIPFMAPMMLGQGEVPILASLWSPTDKAGTISLSNGGKTATNGSGADFPSARGATPRNSGKVYIEGTITRVGSNGLVGFGVALANAPLSGNPQTTNTSRYYRADGYVLGSGSGAASVPALSNGKICAVAADFSAGTFAFYLNNVLQTTVSWSPGGSVFPYFTCYDVNDAVTLSSIYAPPAGFLLWG